MLLSRKPQVHNETRQRRTALMVLLTLVPKSSNGREKIRGEAGGVESGESESIESEGVPGSASSAASES